MRPRAHVVGCLVHGYMVAFAVTEPDLPKDSATHCELIAHILTKLAQQGVVLSEVSFTLQCDNTPRECKNGIVMAFLTSLVSRGFLDLNKVFHSILGA